VQEKQKTKSKPGKQYMYPDQLSTELLPSKEFWGKAHFATQNFWQTLEVSDLLGSKSE